MALAIDKKGTLRREQAFELVRYQEGMTGLRFLIPEAVQRVVFEKPWHLARKSMFGSGKQLKLYMEKQCDLRNSYPSHIQNYLNFEVIYDQDLKPVTQFLNGAQSCVHKLTEPECDAIQNSDDGLMNPIARELRQQNTFARSILRQRSIYADGRISASLLSRCMSTEANRGISRYMNENDLPGLKIKSTGKMTGDVEDEMTLGPLMLANKDDFCRATAYARDVDQHINLVQCLYFRETGEVLISRDSCKKLIKKINAHDKKMLEFRCKKNDVTVKERDPAVDLKRSYFTEPKP